MKDIRLMNPAAWTNAIIYCKSVNVCGIKVISRVNDNGDGLNFDGCQDVTVSNCIFDNSDDSICLQASSKEYPCRNITITNCIMTSKWAAIRIGLLSIGDFYDVTVDNCVFHDVTDAGLKIQMNEGGRMENFVFSNLVMKEVTRAVLMTFNNFTVFVDGPTKSAPMQSMKNFSFNNFRVETKLIRKDDVKPLILITGLPGHNIENLTFSNISMTGPGGGTVSDGNLRSIPELDGIRPEFFQFGKVVPAYGVYARHVKGLHMDNIFMNVETPDKRPPMIFDDVEDLELSACKAFVSPDTVSMIRLQNVRNAWIYNCKPLAANEVFLQVEGGRSSGILLTNCNLQLVKKSFTCDNGASEKIIKARNNIVR
jgi:polygalacturonase